MKFTMHTTWTAAVGATPVWAWYDTDPPTGLVPAKIEPRPPVDSDSTALAIPT